MSLHGFSYTTCDFATHKQRKRNTKYHKLSNQTLNRQVLLTISAFPQTATQKSRIGLLHKKPICWRHPINLNNNITDISQKKDLPKTAKDTKSIAYLCDTKQWKVEVAYSKMQDNSTLDAPKTLEWHPKQSSRSQSCLLKGKKHKMLQKKS